MIPMSSLLRYYVESSICGHYATYALHTSVPDAFFTIVMQCEVGDWLEVYYLVQTSKQLIIASSRTPESAL